MKMRIPFNFFRYSCHQLSTADKKENQPRELKFSTSINFSAYIKISVQFFSYQRSSAVNSRQQLTTADENENQAKELKLGTSINFSVYIKIPVDFFLKSAAISC